MFSGSIPALVTPFRDGVFDEAAFRRLVDWQIESGSSALVPCGTERPKIVEIVSWAAGNGDRSENGDYLYGRKRMREIDRELAHLARRMKALRVVDPARQDDRSKVFFGARVELADENDDRLIVTLVGDDEQDASAGRIGWSAPLARALRGAALGDLRTVRLPSGEREWEITAIEYPEAKQLS